jgi:hypothetical protein
MTVPAGKLKRSSAMEVERLISTVSPIAGAGDSVTVDVE